MTRGMKKGMKRVKKSAEYHEKSARILAFLKTYYKNHGYMPTYREIMSGADISSMCVVRTHLEDLVAKRDITHTPGGFRTIALVNREE